MRTVRNLIEGRSSVVTVSDKAIGREALDLMITHDYHQLPVVDAARRPLGMVSFSSLSRVATFSKTPLWDVHVRSALERPRHFRPDDDINDVLSALKDAYAALV